MLLGLLLTSILARCAALSMPGATNRRALVLGAPLASLATTALPRAAPAAVASERLYAELSARMAARVVAQSSAPPGVRWDDATLPAWLAGRWRCEQALLRYLTPLGARRG